MAKAAPSSSQAAALTCPECGKSFTRPAALGAHRKMTHGVAGSSANATANRKRTATRTRSANAGGTTGAPRRAASAATTRGNGGIDRDALLRALFPNGIPPRQDVIGQVNAWLDEAERLARAR
jgi:hypothetical protein